MSVLSPEPINYRWSRDNYSELARTIDIWRTVLMFSWMVWSDGKKWSYIGGKTEAKVKKRTRKRAIWLRESMLQLGPTFIKVGQLLSTRADILPTESVEELSKLQDEVPAFTAARAKQIIESELGKPIDQMFGYFDPIPLAAASLGQVHKAQLHTGEEIVIKVQRPGLLKLFAIDLGILKKIAEYFQNHPKHGKGRDWVGIYNECQKILYQEADYLNEGRNADTFRRNFRGDRRILVPRVYWRYASRRVLTLEYMPGIKVSNYDALEAAGLDRKVIARIGAESYLEQLLNHGQIQSITREKLLKTFFAIAQKDGEAVINSLVELGALEVTGDTGPLRRSVQYMLDNFMGKSMEKQSVAAISDDLYDIAYDQPFRFPATFTFVMRALSTLEGLGKGLDPNFNFMEVAQPYATNLMENGNAKESGNLSTAFLGELGRQATQMSNTAIALPRRIDETLSKLDRGDIRVRVKSQETDRLLRRLSNVAIGGIYALLGATCLLCATLLLINSLQIPAVIAAIAAGLFLLVLLRSLSRIDRPER